jgi:hypothetical protein
MKTFSSETSVHFQLSQKIELFINTSVGTSEGGGGAYEGGGLIIIFEHRSYTGPVQCSLVRVFIKEFVGFEVLTAVVARNCNFWNIMQCSPLKVNRFGRTYCVHRQGLKRRLILYGLHGVIFQATASFVNCSR